MKRAGSRFERSRLLDRLQFLAGLEADCFAGRDGDFGAGSRVASDAGLSGTDVEHAKATQFYAIGFGLRDTGFVDDFVDDVEFDHVRLPRESAENTTKCLMLREISEIVNGRQCRVG